jgi:hypothetical protein
MRGTAELETPIIGFQAPILLNPDFARHNEWSATCVGAIYNASFNTRNNRKVKARS